MPVDRPKADRDYPGSYADLLAWFPTDAACLEYLEWLRWGADGFSCPHCESAAGWKLPDGRWSCAGCRRRVSVTAGTIFHGTRTPLTLWFAAAWEMTSQKNGISALGLKRVLDLGSMQTAWALFRSRNKAHYPEPTIMPTSGAPALVGAGVVGGQLGIITGLRGRRSADRWACSARAGLPLGRSGRGLAA